MIKCSVSPLGGTIFLKPAPKFDCTIREGIIVFINVLNSKRQSYQCSENKNPLSGCKVSTFFHFVSVSDDPFPAPSFYWRALWPLWRHTTSIAAQSFCILFMNQIDLKMPINKSISVKLYGEIDLLRPQTHWSPHTAHQTDCGGFIIMSPVKHMSPVKYNIHMSPV